MTYKEYCLTNFNYEVKTTFFDDFSIADRFGAAAIKDTFKRALNEWKNNYVYITELCMVLNHKCLMWYNKNLSKVGTASVSLSQLSDQVAKFIQFAKLFYSGDYDGFTISLTANDGTPVAYCHDCYFTKIPDQSFGENAAMQTWTLTCGEVDFQ